ncbi:MAG: histidine kinase [Geminicoccaceae bacterium]|jgi:CBS domain-containing protein|nr:MAG: histidine kinase [Geminicoccaceae bacterium]
MQVRDVMTTKVITVRPDTPVTEIARLLVENRISGVPVVDEENRVLGIVSEGDLIRRLEDTDDGRRRSWWLELLASPERRAEEYVKAHGRLARDIMTDLVTVIDEGATLAEVARLLEEKHVKRLPVVRDGKLVGIVSRADLLRALALAPPQEAKLDDRAIREKLLAELERAGQSYHPYVNIVVSDGVVHLWGFVGSAREAEAMVLAARNVPGVVSVDSHLAVRPALGAV